MPAQYSGEFVARMEDILEVYALPYDPKIPLVCMDEQPYQLLGESREPVPMKPGQPGKQDYEYTREGTCSIFMFTEPLNGTRHVHVSRRRTKQDWALRIQELLDSFYPDVKRVRLVMDNLNTHTISSLYETFPPEVALNLARRLDIHFTPKHGSWLNIAEIELSAMTKQCLGRRIASIDKLQDQLSAWEAKRNSGTKSVDWQFKTEDARIKLKWLYPKI
ncbi:MAG TPA: IS630 family transposase [Clostridia bacterium]|nr:IS630 family transposase [Clostridia bacterium]